MAVGQGVLRAVLDVGALDALEARLEQQEVARSAAHAVVLRDVLELHRVLTAGGCGLTTVAQVALSTRGSEFRAATLLADAQLLSALPGALEALDCGLLTIEQSRIMCAQLGPLDEPVQLAVWLRLQARLIADEAGGIVRTPARLRALLTGWVIEADAEAAARRRRDAEAEASVDYRRRDDGLVDIFATGLSGPNAQAVLARIRDHSTPVGSSDDRPAGQRRLDAFVDLILGRDRRTLDGELGSCATGHDTPGCGCPVGAPAPCGTDVQVLIPLGAALGVTGELAELVGHGPLDPDLTFELLLAAPVLRPVWVDDAGVPVATGRAVQWPARRDIRGLGAALRRLAASRPGTFVPRHPDDHAGRAHDAAVLGLAALDQPAGTGPAGGPRLLTRPHPTGTPGPYQVPAGLRRLLEVRRPQCEWPSCGARSSRCDLDHDRAWPHGPTCGCNLGPLCRRHHRIKQLGWTKKRTADAGVRWMSPAGRSWTSPTPHSPPASPDRSPPRRISPSHEDDDGDDHHWVDDPAGLELRAEETEPADEVDRTAEQPQHTDTRWNLQLDKPLPVDALSTATGAELPAGESAAPIFSDATSGVADQLSRSGHRSSCGGGGR